MALKFTLERYCKPTVNNTLNKCYVGTVCFGMFPSPGLLRLNLPGHLPSLASLADPASLLILLALTVLLDPIRVCQSLWT
jgi:hypothetical protein